ncbi:MAG: hypothetical protein WBD20_07985 [Pirellulaceae bacterium]
MSYLRLMVVAVGLAVLGVTIAQEPRQIALPSEQPVTPVVDPNAVIRSGVESNIQEALKGQTVETGDGLLDDMLKVLKQRGSVLDGSSLDKELDISSDGSSTRKAVPSVSQKAHAAESLLRASRLLENLGKLTDEQSELIQQMRHQSLLLLSPTPSK